MFDRFQSEPYAMAQAGLRDGDPLREVLSVGRRTSSGDRAGSLGVRRMLQRSNGADRGQRGTGAQASGGGVAGAAQGTYGVMSLFPLLCFPNPANIVRGR